MRVEVVSIEHRTPNPDRKKWQLHASGVPLDELPMKVNLSCGCSLEFENKVALLKWFRESSHQFERVGSRFTIDGHQCGKSRGDMFERLRDGRILIRIK